MDLAQTKQIRVMIILLALNHDDVSVFIPNPISWITKTWGKRLLNGNLNGNPNRNHQDLNENLSGNCQDLREDAAE
jgi:hypothetical protein